MNKIMILRSWSSMRKVEFKIYKQFSIIMEAANHDKISLKIQFVFP